MKKRIMFFINTLAGGGAERVLVNLLKDLDLKKYDITVITIFGGENLKDIPPEVHVRQIIKKKNYISDFYNKLIHKIPRSWFAKLFLKGDFDVEIAYLPGFPTRALAAKHSKESTKKYAFVHGKIDDSSLKTVCYSNKEECHREYESFDRVCFVSEDAKKCLEGCIGKLSNAEVVYNVINRDEIKEKARESTDIAYTTKGTKFVAVGRLVEVKGFDRLLKAVKELKENYDFELWILGQGHLYDELNDYINDNNLDNVRLLGYRDNPYKYIGQANYFVCSSYSEGYSTATIEALTVGTPVITTDCPGMKEILCDDKYGFIVENSEEGIKNGLELVMKDKELGEKIKKNVKEYSENGNFDTALEKYIELLDA